MQQRITIIRINKPLKREVNAELQWLGTSLDLFGLRDKDKSCFRLFVELVKNLRHQEQLTSDELAHKLNLSRGTVIHHLAKLMDAGIVLHERNRYLLRVGKLEAMIEEMQKDSERMFDDLMDIAKDIDERLGL